MKSLFKTGMVPTGTSVPLEDCLSELSRAVSAVGGADECPSGTRLEAELVDLYEEHAASLVRYAISFCGDPDLARDAVQDCFLRYFEVRRLGSNLEQPRAWLVRVLRNQLIDQRRREQLHQGLSASTLRELHSTGPFGDEAGVDRLWKRIEALVTPKELQCLQLRAAGFTYAEIAVALGVQSGTVSVLLSRSREKAAAMLGPQRVSG